MLGQPGYPADRHDDDSGLGLRLDPGRAEAEGVPGPLVVAVDPGEQDDEGGTATTTTQAPSVNLVTRKITVATAVTTAPRPLMAARCCQPRGRLRHQCTTKPAWASVKPVNTPMANSGISLSVLPPPR